MTWDAKRAEARIQKFLATVPAVESGVVLAKDARARGDLDALPIRRTSLVEGAHLYGQLLDFDEIVADQGEETEKSHARLLQFLNDYYRLWDAIVFGEDGHRVDYHGARLHAVVTEPTGNANEQVAQAVALAYKLNSAASELGVAHGIAARIRFGIDHGRCLSMTTGRSHERDTLYLGSPANYAAKKAAESKTEGVFLASGAQRVVGSQSLAKSYTGEQVLTESYVRDAAGRYRFEQIETRAATLVRERKEGTGTAAFHFRRHTPPLSDLKFADLSPSKSVRMGMAAVFADIDGFTKYVDHAISGGSATIKNAVKTVHVIREELNAVLKEDFGGKRIRFIGDCIHGCIAAGQNKDDAASAIQDARLCAEGMRSSFDICVKHTDPSANLDLAIGIEYGPVPMSRLGTPGDDSVRCAVARAVVEAERLQQSIDGGGIKIGAVARSNVSASLQKYFSADAALVGYPAMAELLAAPASPAVQIIRENPAARPHADELR